MLVTAADIEAEHERALATLSIAQRRAIERLAVAEACTWRTPDEFDRRLGAAFALEAAARNLRPANEA